METQEMKHTIKVIAFDADDTLWSNEPFFQEVERKYTELLSEYGNPKEISVELFNVWAMVPKRSLFQWLRLLCG